MKRNLVFLFITVVLIVSGCTQYDWEHQTMQTENIDTTIVMPGNGDIPKELSGWKIVTNVSEIWFDCDIDFVLKYSKMSIDQENRIWIYGPDLWNGPIGGIPDNPGCEGLGAHRRIIIYDQNEEIASVFEPDLGEGIDLSSASGWTHLDNDRVLLNSVFIYATPWDSPDGGENNKFIDIAILEGTEFRELIHVSHDYFSVPDYAISRNLLYVIMNTVEQPHPQIIVYSLETEKQTTIYELTSCDYPRSIEASNEHIFLLCKESDSTYSLFIYTNDFREVKSWIGQITITPNLGNRGSGFPLALDTQGRLWVGYSYVAKEESEKWVLESLSPSPAFLAEESEGFSPKPIFGMLPYKNMMLFSVEGLIFLADYDNKEWRVLMHNSSPLPIAIGTDGMIFVFTGKYILSSTP
jgi:hypothetical protein